MKEKIIVTISIVGFFGIMALSTKIHNNLNTTISNSSILIEEVPQKNSDDILIETNHLEDDAISSEKISDELSSCSLNSNTVDNLAFGNAFKYYRQCLGKGSNFQWKGKTYSTLLLEEVNIQLADSTESKEMTNKNNEISGIR